MFKSDIIRVLIDQSNPSLYGRVGNIRSKLDDGRICFSIIPHVCDDFKVHKAISVKPENLRLATVDEARIFYAPNDLLSDSDDDFSFSDCEDQYMFGPN